MDIETINRSLSMNALLQQQLDHEYGNERGLHIYYVLSAFFNDGSGNGQSIPNSMLTQTFTRSSKTSTWALICTSLLMSQRSAHRRLRCSKILGWAYHIRGINRDSGSDESFLRRRKNPGKYGVEALQFLERRCATLAAGLRYKALVDQRFRQWLIKAYTGRLASFRKRLCAVYLAKISRSDLNTRLDVTLLDASQKRSDTTPLTSLHLASGLACVFHCLRKPQLHPLRRDISQSHSSACNNCCTLINLTENDQKIC